MNLEAVQAGAAYLPRPLALTTPDRLDDYVQCLTQAIRHLIDQTVP